MIRAAATAVLAFCLTGCAQPSPGPTDGWLAFTQCALDYPDGTPVPCVDQAERIEATPGFPPAGSGWLCNRGLAGYRSYERVDNEAAFGVSYPAVGLGGTVHGQLVARVNSDVQRLYAWETTDGRHFVSGEKGAESTGASVILYNASVTAAPPSLAGLEPRFVWSIWQGGTWLVLAFDAADRTYWIPTMVPTPWGYAPHNVHLEVGDETLDVQLDHSGGYGWGVPGLDPACNLLGPEPASGHGSL